MVRWYFSLADTPFFFLTNILTFAGHLYLLGTRMKYSLCLCNASGNLEVWWVLAKIPDNFLFFSLEKSSIWTNWVILPLFSFSLGLVRQARKATTHWQSYFLFSRQVAAFDTDSLLGKQRQCHNFVLKNDSVGRSATRICTVSWVTVSSCTSSRSTRLIK